jgi:hypothetical protein
VESRFIGLDVSRRADDEQRGADVLILYPTRGADQQFV